MNDSVLVNYHGWEVNLTKGRLFAFNRTKKSKDVLTQDGKLTVRPNGGYSILMEVDNEKQ